MILPSLVELGALVLEKNLKKKTKKSNADDDRPHANFYQKNSTEAFVGLTKNKCYRSGNYQSRAYL